MKEIGFPEAFHEDWMKVAENFPEENRACANVMLAIYRHQIQSIFLVAKSAVGWGYVFKGISEQLFPQRKIQMRIVSPRWNMESVDRAAVRDAVLPHVSERRLNKYRSNEAELDDLLRTVCRNNPYESGPDGRTYDDARLTEEMEMYGKLPIGNYGIFDHEIVFGRAIDRCRERLELLLRLNTDAQCVWMSKEGDPKLSFDEGDIFYRNTPSTISADELAEIRSNQRRIGINVDAPCFMEGVPGLHARKQMGREMGGALRSVVEKHQRQDWDITDEEIGVLRKIQS